MNKIIYLLAVHKNPKQVKRLIARLKSDHSFFYVHVDLKSSIQEFKDVTNDSRVSFIESREDCIWGDFSQVKATLNLIDAALADHQSGRFILLSGEDYPIKSTNYIEDFYTENALKNFIELAPIEKVWEENERRSRTDLYKINYSNQKSDFILLKPRSYKQAFKLLLKGKINFSTFCDILQKRDIPFPLYGGSNWWSLNHEMLNAIQHFVRQNRTTLFTYFKYVKCCDELFFQTVIKLLQKNDSSINYQPMLTYVNWTRENYDNLPVIFNQDDLTELTSQGDNKLFARKFDCTYDETILDLLDEKFHNVNSFK